MKNFLTLCSMLILTACATTGKFDNKCQSWVGKSESELVSSWGIPTNKYEIDSDTKLIEYLFSNGTRLMSTGYSAVAVNMSCKVTFTSQSGTISRYQWAGNACRSK